MHKAYLAALMSLLPFAAQANEGCMLVMSYPQAAVLHESGDCTTRHPPASTFKIPLALMGFDAGILQDAHTPRWPPTLKYGPITQREQQEADATIWLKDSIIWFSRRITEQLGAMKFQDYITRFDYGNKDVTGTKGTNDGLLNAWLFTSLTICAREQAGFIHKLLSRELRVTDTAYDMTIASMPRFMAGDWQVLGKTGSGTTEQGAQQGWFVGWAQRGTQQIIFTKLMFPPAGTQQAAGPYTRDTFLRELPNLMAQSNDAP